MTGFPADTLVRRALELLAESAGVSPRWRVAIDKRIPVAAGLGGGSSDAATALRLANRTLARPLSAEALHAVAAAVGSDVPFFLADGPQLGSGDGTVLEPAPIPQDFWVVLVLPRGERKASTGAVYERFDARSGADGYDRRREALREVLVAVDRPRDLASLPANDLAASPLAEQLRAAGAFRADVTGAGPAVYGLFSRRPDAELARRSLARFGRTWITVPAWYG
ncbi:MAG TPA: hypothetical protein VG144_02970 [Gaiellaceae bacterium]|nr:hypothetical protein [Gaiellaceae bacterium]